MVTRRTRDAFNMVVNSEKKNQRILEMQEALISQDADIKQKRASAANVSKTAQEQQEAEQQMMETARKADLKEQEIISRREEMARRNRMDFLLSLLFPLTGGRGGKMLKQLVEGGVNFSRRPLRGEFQEMQETSPMQEAPPSELTSPQEETKRKREAEILPSDIFRGIM